MNEQDFSDYPEILNALRAEKEQSAAAWSPRDVLLYLLKEIDSGNVDPEALVVCYADKYDGQKYRVGYRVSSPSYVLSLGMLEATKFTIMNG